MTSEIQIPAFTSTCLVITAVVCIVAVLVAWYTVRDRVKFSQIILGIFSYLLVMLLESFFGSLGVAKTGLGYGLYVVFSVVAAREIVRFAAMSLGVRRNFDGADAAIGFALGFAGAYLFICGAYYFNCYTAAREFLQNGLDSFVAGSGADAGEAVALLRTIADQDGWQFLATGVNRVFYLVREIALCVLLWYAMAEDGDKRWYALIPAMHVVAMLPDGLFQAGLLTSSYVRDAATCLISGGITYLAARQYNAREDQVAHYRLERLYAKRRK